MRRTLGVLMSALIVLAAARASAAPQLISRVGFDAPANWAGPIVPRARADADLVNPVVLSDTLFSGRPTYLNWSTGKNASAQGWWTDAVYLDGALADSASRVDWAWAHDLFPLVNHAAVTVRGGRHELKGVADITNTVSYPTENYNSPCWTTYTWSPEALPASLVTTSATPPPPYYTGNIGYELDRTSPYAFVISSVTDLPGDDMALRFYVDPWLGSTTGFQTEGAGSAIGPGQVNFVVGSGGPATVYPALSGWTGVPVGGYSLGWADAAGRRDSSGTGRWPGALPARSMATIYEVWMTAGVPFHAALARASGADDLALATGPPVGGTNFWSRQISDGNSVAVSGTDTDVLAYTPSFTGWHPLVVYRVTSADRASAQDYVLQLGATIASVDGPNARLFLAPPSPNPVAGPARLAFGLARAGAARLAIFDAQGRALRTLVAGTLAAGPHDASWDLRDARGAAVPNGSYWALLQAGGRELTTHLVVMR